MLDRILKKGAVLSSYKIKITPEIQKSIDDIIKQQKELRKIYAPFTFLIIPVVSCRRAQ